MEIKVQFHVVAALPSGNKPCTHWIGGWLGRTASTGVLETVLFLLEFEPRIIHTSIYAMLAVQMISSKFKQCKNIFM